MAGLLTQPPIKAGNSFQRRWRFLQLCGNYPITPVVNDGFSASNLMSSLAGPDYKAFWECQKRLPGDIATPTATHFIPALLIKKGGDFPDFWKQSMTFPSAMKGAYEAIRKKSKAW
ncbi:hypothetical protein [Methylomonas lenta]|nr:hypothetical protein [Methylomonas lenta]